MSLFPTMTTAIVSTAHMSEKDAEILNTGGCLNVMVDKIDGGYLVYCENYNEPHVFEPLSVIKQGMTQAFATILIIAASQGCTHVRFDCDAEEIDGLPTFDW